MLGNIARYAYGGGRSTRELVGKANRELLLGIPTNSRRSEHRHRTLGAPAAARRLSVGPVERTKDHENPDCLNLRVFAFALDHVDDTRRKVSGGFRVDVELQRHLRAADAGKLGDNRMSDLADLRTGARSVERDDAEEVPGAGVLFRGLLKLLPMQSEPPPSEAQRYRELAREVRLDAERGSNPTFRRQLLDIAAQYDVLAASAERRPR
jgi:hypothetical protein